MDDDEDDYDFMEDSLQNERFTVKIGPKGKLTTQHTNRRVVKQRDFFNEFRSKLGDAAATEIIERFNRLNLGTTALEKCRCLKREPDNFCFENRDF